MSRSRIESDSGRENPAIAVVQADSDDRWAVARRLIEEYAASLPVALDFQGFEEEIESLAREYAPPRGALLLAERGRETLGCIALREISASDCEMKRLYVPAAGRGLGVGRTLVAELIARARALGYERMLLDTLPTMIAARRLYASFGFEPIAAYRYNPVPGTAYLALHLKPEG